MVYFPQVNTLGTRQVNTGMITVNTLTTPGATFTTTPTTYTMPSQRPGVGGGVPGAQEYGTDTGSRGFGPPNNKEEWRQRAEDAHKHAIDQKKELLEYEWQTLYEADQTAFSNQIEQDALNEANRALAEAAARYGYMRSAGAGTAGMWEMGQYNMESKAMAVRSSIATLNGQYMRDLKTAWMNKKDDQAFQKDMLKLQAEYREQYAEKVAELNDSSWWSKIGSVVGTIAAIASLIPTGGASAGGIVGSGTGASMGNWLNYGAAL